MTDKHELIALAKRVEALTGPCREADILIAEAKGWTATQNRQWFTPPNLTVQHHRRELPRFTASLDAAMTLVPEGWWWTTGNCSVSADASMGPDVAHCSKEILLAFDEGLHHDLPHPSTPAISLTALALRARAAIIEWERQQ